MAKDVGISADKEKDFSEWYTQVLLKAQLIDYSDVSGCYVFRPASYGIWEKVQQYFDAKIKALGVKNCYFPMLIPEKLLKKEQEHVEGFVPEVAWVTHAGETKLNERLAIRPTSETIMYSFYAKWIRSHRDLPLKLNQWVNVLRWEFKDAKPFLRSREFLWQEGHSAFANENEADEEVYDILDIYAQLYKEIFAIPVIKGRKTEREKFPGARFSTSVEILLPDGKGLQAATSHSLGQNFSKAFNISFLDEQENSSFVWQNSWGLSTRSIGAMVIMHGDNKGVIVPPGACQNPIVIVPIYSKENASEVISACRKVAGSLEKFGAILDDREGYTPGWKFNDWEMRGIPLRIEIGPKDIKEKAVVFVRRDTGKKETVAVKNAAKRAEEVLKEIHDSLYQKAEQFMKKSVVSVNNLIELKRTVSEKRFGKAAFCNQISCEEKIRELEVKSLCIPLNEDRPEGSCFACKKPATCVSIFGRAY